MQKFLFKLIYTNFKVKEFIWMFAYLNKFIVTFKVYVTFETLSKYTQLYDSYKRQLQTIPI